MYGMSDSALLRLWELSLTQHPIDLALSILSAAEPDCAWETLTELSIGERDRRLLRVRQQTFGDRLAARADCPACAAALELDLSASALMLPPADETAPLIFEYEGITTAYRLPNSRDLAAIIGCADADSGQAVLLNRCVLSDASPELLPAGAAQALADEMARRDPQAEIEFTLECPSCGANYTMLFDILSYLTVEITAEAKRLLREIHHFARHYGWREADVLALSRARRMGYLELMANE